MICNLINSIRIRKNINELLNSVYCSLTEDDVKNAKDFITYGEWTIAFDLICTQLYEYDAIISNEQLEIIRKFANLMQLEDDSWNFLLEILQRLQK